MRRTAALLLLATALAGCGSSAEPTPSARNAATSPASDATAPATSPPTAGGSGSTTPSAESRSAAPLRYAVLGDSYSNGESVAPSAAWPQVLAETLTRDGLPVDVVANPSVTGATTAQMIDTGLGPIRAARPDVITVMLGVNDQFQGRTTEQFAADDDRALRAAIEITGSPARVLAIDLPDYGFSPAGARFGAPAQITAQIDAFNAVVRRVAERRRVRVVSVVDLSRRFGSGGIASDGLHPSEAQLRAWAERIAPVALRAWRPLAREPATP